MLSSISFPLFRCLFQWLYINPDLHSLQVLTQKKLGYTNVMKPQDLIDYFGNMNRVAKALGVSLPSVCKWVELGEVPELRQYQAQLATGGALLADAPALRSDA
jgi:hypothetical protein